MTDHRERLRSLGWTDRDIDEYVRRHGDRLLFALRELPTVVEATDGDVDEPLQVLVPE